MDGEQILLTKHGMQKLQEELNQLKDEERPSVIKAIAEARAHGDLSENAEYSSALEKQGFVEGRISELESIVARAQVIEPERLATDGRAVFGCHVEIRGESGNIEVFQIVGTHESHLGENRVSTASPIGRALIGKSAGDTVVVAAPAGDIEYEILAVRFS